MSMFDWQAIEWHYINLASRPDRDAHARAEFAKAGLGVTRFEAFTPDQWRGTPEQIARMLSVRQGGTPGAPDR